MNMVSSTIHSCELLSAGCISSTFLIGTCLNTHITIRHHPSTSHPRSLRKSPIEHGNPGQQALTSRVYRQKVAHGYGSRIYNGYARGEW